GAGRAFAFDAGAGQLDGAPKRRTGGETAGDVYHGAAMLERQRIDESRLVGSEIVVVDRRAAGLQVGGDVARQRAFIVFARAAVAQPLVGLAEIAELEMAYIGLPIERRHAATIGQVVGLGCRELREV